MVRASCIAALLAFAAVAAASGPFEAEAFSTPETPLDKLVFARLQRLGIEPAKPCSDGVFLRRVHLDLIGTLPTAEEARTFLLDPDPDKRRILVDRLLRRDEFADYWAMRWADLLRVKAEFPINLWPNAVQAYHRWIRTAIRDNKPYDQFARELLTSSGSNFRVPQVNFYRAVQGREPRDVARAVALTFMGERAENWPKERLEGMAGFFALVGYKQTLEWKEEIVHFDLARAAAGPMPVAVFPDGTPARLFPDVDPRDVFAGWLVRPENPWFTRNIANRTWSWMLGRGIIHEPDDARPDNPPVDAELLALLEKEVVAAKYDLRQVLRVIANSRTYQLSSIPRSKHPAAAAHFAQYPVRRLEAEVLIDALCRITGTTERYSSAIPEPFTFIPEENRTIALADGSITSPFLEMFGRPPRDTGLESERNNRTSPTQRLHLLNSTHVQRKIEQGRKLSTLTSMTDRPAEAIDAIYLTILSRFPTDGERAVTAAHFKSGHARGREVLIDIAWALLNSAEFLHRH